MKKTRLLCIILSFLMLFPSGIWGITAADTENNENTDVYGEMLNEAEEKLPEVLAKAEKDDESGELFARGLKSALEGLEEKIAEEKEKSYTVTPKPLFSSSAYSTSAVIIGAAIYVPITGETPSGFIEVPSDSGYSAKIVAWYENGVRMRETDTFKSGKSYTAEIRFTPDSGYMFPDSIEAYAFGIDMNFSVGTLKEKDGLSLTYSFNFLPKTGIYDVTLYHERLIPGESFSLAFRSSTDAGCIATLVYAEEHYNQHRRAVSMGDIIRNYAYDITVLIIAKEGYIFSPELEKITVFDTAYSSEYKITDVYTDGTIGFTATLHPINADRPLLTVTNGTAESDYLYDGAVRAGDEVVIKADPSGEGMSFSHWETDNENVIFDGIASSTASFIMPNEDVEIEAVYSPLYSITVEGGSSLYPNEVYGHIATITADAPPEGYFFSKWEIVDGEPIILDEYASETQFLMPDGPVSLKAVFSSESELFNITVIGGTAHSSDGVHNSNVYLTPETQEGKYFYGWAISEGYCNISNPHDPTAFINDIRGNVTLEAVFLEPISELTFTAMASAPVPGMAKYPVLISEVNGSELFSLLIDGENSTYAWYYSYEHSEDASAYKVYYPEYFMGDLSYELYFDIFTDGYAKFAEDCKVKIITPSGEMNGNITYLSEDCTNIAFDIVYDLTDEEKLYTLTLINGTVSEIKAKAGEEVTITAVAKEGKVFDLWDMRSDLFTLDRDKSIASTVTFIMPASDITVAATYADASDGCTVTVYLNAPGTGSLSAPVYLLDPADRSTKGYNVITGRLNPFCSINYITAGEYILQVSAPGYLAVEIPVTVDARSMRIYVDMLLFGDVNADGKVNAADATQIKRYYNNKSSVFDSYEGEIPEYVKKIADVNADDKINAADATQIKRYYNNKPSVFDKLTEE